MSKRQKYIPFYYPLSYRSRRDFWIGLRLDESKLPDTVFIHEDGTIAEYFKWFAYYSPREPNHLPSDRCIRFHFHPSYTLWTISGYCTTGCCGTLSFLCEYIGKPLHNLFDDIASSTKDKIKLVLIFRKFL